MAKRWKRVEDGIEEAVNASERTKKRFRVRRMVDGKSTAETFETLEEAQAATRSFKKGTAKFGKLTSKYIDADWREFTEAKRHLPPGVSLVEAAIFYAARKVKKDRPQTFEAATKLFLAAKKDNLSDRQYSNLETACKEIEAFWGHLELDAVTSDTVLKCLLGMQPKRSPRTIRNYFADWRTFFNWLKRRGFIDRSPLDSITAADLPKVRTSKKNPLTVEQARACLAATEEKHPKWALWQALQFFLGFREAEASRFRYEWIQRDQSRVMIPGWFFDEGTERQGSKTQDDWAIYDVPDVFWIWFEKYGKKSGKISHPSRYEWSYYLQPCLLKALKLKAWPSNAKRDSFCTYHISLYKEPNRTALVLKHRSAERLWQSYLGTMVSKEEAEQYFAIQPIA